MVIASLNVPRKLDTLEARVLVREMWLGKIGMVSRLVQRDPSRG